MNTTKSTLTGDLKTLQNLGQKAIPNAHVFKTCGLKEKKPPQWQNQNAKTDVCLETLSQLEKLSTCDCSKLGYVFMPIEFFGDE